MQKVMFPSSLGMGDSGVISTVPTSKTVELTIGSNTSNYTAIDSTQLILYVDFTIGSLTSCDLTIEFQDPYGTDWFQETNDSVSVGTTTESAAIRRLTATGKYRIAVPLRDTAVKVSVTGNGVATSSSIRIRAGLGTN